VTGVQTCALPISHSLFQPAVAPPVFPITQSADRFNDLYAASRFTSACSSHVARSPMFRHQGHDSLFVCEPVHNLVHRSIVVPDGSTFRAERVPRESESEFLASSDPWFRPVCAKVGPDGSLWVADMYRQVIEHPEWIPDAWQQQVDLRGGADRGRIYRVTPADENASPQERFASRSTADLVQELRSPVGPRRDIAHRLLLQREPDEVAESLKRLAANDPPPQTMAHVLSILARSDALTSALLLAALESETPGLVCVAVKLSEPKLDSDQTLLDAVCELVRSDERSVLLQVALSLGESDSDAATAALAQIANRADIDPWVARAVASSAAGRAVSITKSMVETFAGRDNKPSPVSMRLFADAFATARDSGADLAGILNELVASEDVSIDTRFVLATGAIASGGAGAISDDLIGKLRRRALAIASDSQSEPRLRARALDLIATDRLEDADQVETLLALLSPASPPVVSSEAIDCLTRHGDAEIAEALISRWPSMPQSLRTQCATGMLSRGLMHERLLAAIEDKRIRLSDLTPATKQQLMQSGSRSMKVRAARLVNPSTSRNKRRLVNSYLEAFGRDAESLNGKALFEKHCGVCHVANESSAAIGASLENLSDKSAPVLVTAVLDPNRAVDPKYQTLLVQTASGRVLAGTV